MNIVEDDYSEEVYVVEDDYSKEFVFSVEEVSAVTLDDSQLVTLKLESGKYLRFQPDTGAQCNVIPLHLYICNRTTCCPIWK